ncbi:MAG: restriction endonuclease subunit S, partial [Alkalinema sp. CAN_BIN05]|nr:restriction endonuclease subunit S [Alkalinema sp. CAN_BIN05]
IRITNDFVSSRFVYHFLNQKSVRQTFNTITTGQAYPQISLKQVRDAIIPLPSFLQQQTIATILSDMDIEIGAIETKLTKTRQLKQGMMHELLTGRIRLIDKG